MNTREFASKKEHGALIVEATISLSTFMFAMYMLLNVIQMAYVQERMSVGLDRTAKQMAEYAHVYYAMGLDGKFTGTGGTSSDFANKVADMLKKIGGYVRSDMITNMGSELEGDSLTALAQHGIGVALADKCFKKNVVPTGDGKTGDYEGFLKRHWVSGVSLARSNITNEKLFLRVDYDISVIKFGNFKVDVKFHVAHVSYARAWAGGKD